MVDSYFKYLPEMISSFREFRELGKVETIFLTEEHQAKEEMTANQWIALANEKGLLRRASMMGLLDKWESVEELREMILYYWQSKSPYNYWHLAEWLDGYCGDGMYQMTLNYDRYNLRVVLELKIKQKQGFLLKRIGQMIPANLTLEVLLNVNTHGDIKRLKHGEIMARKIRHGALPLEDLAQLGLDVA